MGLIRFLLALAVLATHCGPIPGLRLPHGDVAVQAFFVISGFYMSLILTDKYRSSADYQLFLSNRLLRIFPGYLVVMTATILLGLLSARAEVTPQTAWLHEASRLSPGARLWVGLVNLTLFGQDIAMFQAVDPVTGSLEFTGNFWIAPVPALKFLLVPQAWSISVELLFYAVAPFILRRPLCQLIAIGGVSLALRLLLAFGFDLRHDPWSYRLFPVELATFLSGALAHRAYRWLDNRRMLTSQLSGALTTVLVTVVAWYGLVPVPHKRFVLMGLLVAALPFVFSLTKDSSADRILGELSYPLYLLQWFALGLLHRVFLHPTSASLGLVSLGLALLFYRFVDRPIDAFRQRRIRSRRTQPVPELVANTATAA